MFRSWCCDRCLRDVMRESPASVQNHAGYRGKRKRSPPRGDPTGWSPAANDDGRESKFFYWDDVPSRRLRPNILTREQALEQARAFARAERDKEPS